MEYKEETISSEDTKRDENKDNGDNEEKKDENMFQVITEDKTPGVGGIAGLLCKTATILGALVQKEATTKATTSSASSITTQNQ